MADKILIRRGLFADLPDLDEGEPGLSTDTGTVYIGTSGTDNILVNPVLLGSDGYTIDGYLIPGTDNVHGLGNLTNRWNSLTVGPGSMHLVSKLGEPAGAKEWSIKIDNSGSYIVIDETSSVPLFELTAAGEIVTPVFSATTSGISFAGAQYLASAGAESLPSYSFTADDDTGIYNISSNELGFALGGVNQWKINSTGVFESLSSTTSIKNANGNANNPAYSFAADPDTGMYRTGTNQLAFSTSGVVRSTIDSVGNMILPDAYVSASNTIGLPTYTFVSDPDTGIARITADTLEFVTAGLSQWTLASNGVLSANQTSARIRGATGGASAPTYSFAGDTDTGMYSPATNSLAFSTASSVRWGINAGGDFTVLAGGAQIIASDGAVGTPSYTFDSTNNLGFYRLGGSGIGMAASGVLQWSFSTGVLVAENNGRVRIGTGSQFTPAYSFAGDQDTGFSNTTSNNLTASTGGQIGWHIDDNQNVGIGINDPSHKLHVDGYVVPYVDNVYNLGTSDLRWKDAYLGPSSLKILARDSDVGHSLNKTWQIGVNVLGQLSIADVTDPNAPIEGFAVSGTGTISAVDGSATEPSYSFINDDDTGIYLDGAGSLAFTTGASSRFKIDNNGLTATDAGARIRLGTGTSSVPAYAFSTDTTTGLFRAAAGAVGFSSSGSETLRFTSTGLLVTSGAEIRTNGNDPNHGIRNVVGPGQTWNGETDFDGPVIFGFNKSALGTFDNDGYGEAIALTWDNSNNVDIRGVLTTSSGTVSAPAHTFASDSDTGMYNPSDGVLAFSVNGTGAWQFQNADGDLVALSNGSVYPGSGFQAFPAHSFSTDTDTGMWRPAANEIGFSTGGTTRVIIDSAGNLGVGPSINPAALLHVRDTATSAIVRVESTSFGEGSLSQSSPGLELVPDEVATGVKFTPAIKFGADDDDLSTTKPKFSAFIAGYVTENWTLDTSSGMGISFQTTPNNAGTTPAPTERMTLDQDGNLTLLNGDFVASQMQQYVQVRRTVDASTSPTTLHNIFSTTATGGTVIVDINSGITFSTTSGVATIGVAGVYEITVLGIFVMATGQLDDYNIEINGSSTYTARPFVHGSVDPVERTINIIRNLSASDTVEVNADGPSALTNIAGSALTIKRIA